MAASPELPPSPRIHAPRARTASNPHPAHGCTPRPLPSHPLMTRCAPSAVRRTASDPPPLITRRAPRAVRFRRTAPPFPAPSPADYTLRAARRSSHRPRPSPADYAPRAARRAPRAAPPLGSEKENNAWSADGRCCRERRWSLPKIRLRPYSAGAHLRVPARLAPIRPAAPHQEEWLYCRQSRGPSQLSPRAKRSVSPREASLALVTPGAHRRQTCALSFPSVKYPFCCFHGMRYPFLLCNKYETIFSRARRKLEERCISPREMSGGRGGERGHHAAEARGARRAARQERGVWGRCEARRMVRGA